MDVFLTSFRCEAAQLLLTVDCTNCFVSATAIFRQLLRSAVSNTAVDWLLSPAVMALLVLWNMPLVGAPPAVEATVCAILQKPSASNGKLVHVKGTVKSAFENFSLSESGCGAISVDFADDNMSVPDLISSS
jgi:hypothetical protein